MDTPDQVCVDTERSEWQRPSIATPVDPRGGFKHNPEFVISGSIDNGNDWNSVKGNQANRFQNC